MRRLMAAGALLAILTGLIIIGPPSASADTRCKKWNPRAGVCWIETKVPGRGGSKQNDAHAEAANSAAGGRASEVCSSGGEVLPCHDGSGGTWSGSRGCYVKRASVQPPKSDPAWDGHTTGSLYWCHLPADQDAFLVWLAAAPGALPPPDPRVLAQQAVAAMGLRAVRIGIVPEDRPGSVGVIGLPTWLWAV